jgi:hypothetical protein
MLGKNGIFHGKSFEKSFLQEIPRNFLRKVIFRRKNVQKIGPCRSIFFVHFFRGKFPSKKVGGKWAITYSVRIDLCQK